MLADYEPQDPERCIRCQENDVIFVQKPFLFHFMVIFSTTEDFYELAKSILWHGACFPQQSLDQCGPNPGPWVACGPRGTFVQPWNTLTFTACFVSNKA